MKKRKPEIYIIPDPVVGIPTVIVLAKPLRLTKIILNRDNQAMINTEQGLVYLGGVGKENIIYPDLHNVVSFSIVLVAVVPFLGINIFEFER